MPVTIEKVVENGTTYRVETDERSVVKMQVDPILRYANVPASVASGDVVSIPMRLEDFDGEPRNDSRTVRFLVAGEPVEVPLVDGELTLELELVARGRTRILLMPEGMAMDAINIEVL